MSPADRALAAWSDELRASFARASRGALDPCRLTLAGAPWRLACASATLRVRLSSPLRHLVAAGDAAPHLTVHAWADDDPPAPPFPCNAGLTHLETARFDVHLEHGGRSSVLDRKTGDAWFWLAAEDDLPAHEHAAPLRLVLQTWCRDRGLLVVHGAAVGIGGRGALVIGRGGAGKSMTALAGLVAGLDFAGDDYVVVDAARRLVHSLYATAKLDAGALAAFPTLRSRLLDARVTRPVLLLEPAEVVRTVPLSLLLLPRRPGPDNWTDQPTTSRPASTADALRALAPSTMLQLRQGGALPALVAMARLVPARWLDLGSSLDGVAAALAGLLCAAPARAAEAEGR